jgi:hypothetical protein
MMTDLTPFAGLIRHHVGEALSEEFLYRNQTIIDRLLQIGAITHHHDGHAALADPVDAPTATVNALGGTIPADTPIYLEYTFLDAQGGETAPSAVLPVSTAPGLPAPDAAPDAVVDHAAGTLLADTYYYAVTVVDGSGGETVLGPAIEVVVDPGSATNQIVLSGLDTIVTDVGGTEWRMWRAVGAGNWVMLNQGAGATMTDDGSFCPDASLSPPETATTNSTSRLTVQVPGPAPAGAVSFNLYLSTDGSFTDPALVATHPVADLGTDIAVNSLTTVAGSPPPVSLTVGGASKIDPDTEVLGVFKRPVANAAALPGAGNTNGDIRETLNDHTLHVWDGAAWQPLGGGGGGGGSLVNPMETMVEWTGPGDAVTRARVYGHMDQVQLSFLNPDYYPVWASRPDEDPANGNAGYQFVTTPSNVVKPSTTTDRSAMDTDGNWSTRTVQFGRAARDILLHDFTALSRLGVGFGDAATHQGIVAWLRRTGVTAVLEIAARTDGSGYGSNDPLIGWTVLASLDVDTPAADDDWFVSLELKFGNRVAASLSTGGKTSFDIPDTDIPAGPIRDAFGDAGTVTKKLYTADLWNDPTSWTTSTIDPSEYKFHPEVIAEVFTDATTSSGEFWTTRRIASDVPRQAALADHFDFATGLQSYIATDDFQFIPSIYGNDGGDSVSLDGRAKRTGAGAVGASEIIGTLKPTSPFGRPRVGQGVPCVIGDDNGSGTGILWIGNDGTISVTPTYVWDVTANPWVDLSALHYNIA